MARCEARTLAGAPCKAAVAGGARFCRWHDPTAEGRERHRAESVKGGKSKAYGTLPAGGPLSASADVAALNLATPAGLVGLLAASLAALARLPFDVRVSNSIGQVATAQRGILEASDLEQRLTALEARAATGPALVRRCR